DLQANIGDACDDGNDLTVDDMLNENCVCAGTPVIPTPDCPLLEANIGDTCDDNNSDTENDMVNEDCECVGTTIYQCTADAGSVTFGDGSLNQSFCADDEVPSTFTFETPVHWNTSLFTRGIITDTSGNIIFISDNQLFVET